MPICEFIHFGQIDPAAASSWEGKRILSIDVDWASDEVLADTLDLVECAGVKACFFITHDTPLLARIRENENLELGLHPNFDPLLRGESGTTVPDIIGRLAELVPEARVLRSHAMTTSGRWLDVYKGAGITHLSNYLMFGVANIHPFRQLNGLVETPVFFADDGLLYQKGNAMPTFEIDKEVAKKWTGVQVYNFHPIHVFLNTNHLDLYAKARPFFGDVDVLRSLRSDGNGSRDWLRNLIGCRNSVTE
jgi:hypothetical protein